MNKYSETLKTIIKQFHTGDFDNLESAIWNAEQLLKEYNVKSAYVDRVYHNFSINSHKEYINIIYRLCSI